MVSDSSNCHQFTSSFISQPQSSFLSLKFQILNFLLKIFNFQFTMKVVAILALCIASGIAAPNGYYSAPAPTQAALRAAYGGYSQSSEFKAAHIPIVRQLVQNDNYGTYSLEYQTGDGITQSESGSLKNIGSKDGPVNVKKGSYSFTAPDGILYTVNYTADENGFHAEGQHLPTPPPIPAEILKSLAIARVPESTGYKSAAVYGGY